MKKGRLLAGLFSFQALTKRLRRLRESLKNQRLRAGFTNTDARTRRSASRRLLASLEQIGHIVGMFFLYREDFLE